MASISADLFRNQPESLNAFATENSLAVHVTINGNFGIAYAARIEISGTDKMLTVSGGLLRKIF